MEDDTTLTPELHMEILAEYNSLRTEMLHRLEMRQTLLTFTLVGAGSLLSIGLQKAEILLVYPILAMFLGLVWAQHDNRIGEIGEYIRLQIETRIPGIQWDSYLRQRYSGKRTRLVEIYAYGLFVVIPVLTVALALPNLTYSAVTIILLAADLGAVLIALMYLRRRRVTYQIRETVQQSIQG